jgi:uncharacterized protein (DUF433 family)
VSTVLGLIAAGEPFGVICAQYDLTPDDIRACVAFAQHNLSGASFIDS